MIEKRSRAECEGEPGRDTVQEAIGPMSMSWLQSGTGVEEKAARVSFSGFSRSTR